MASNRHNGMMQVLIVDDHEAARQALAAVITSEPDLMVAGEAGNGIEAVELVRRLQPDVILMDLIMPHLNGVEAINAICRQWPEAQILVVSNAEDDEHFFDALQAGALGYVRKAVEINQLVTAIRVVGSGVAYLPPNLAQRLVRYVCTSNAHLFQRVQTLTPRELDVFVALGEGCNSRTTAARLGICASTVRIHLRHTQKKLGLRTRAQTAVFAAEYQAR